MPNGYSVVVYIGEALARYGFGAGHPFGPDRMGAFWDHACAEGLDAQVQVRTPVMASEADVLRFHTPDYVRLVQARSVTGEGFLDYGDTPAFVGVWEAGLAVVGCVLDACERIIGGDCRYAFVPIAGLHHARRDSAAGFCAFNDCGIAIETLRVRHNIRRIAYVDIDAHHGDGVFYAFEADPELCFVDFHEDGRYLYPGTGAMEETGEGAAQGHKLNIPLPPQADDALFLQAWEAAEDFIRAARPEFILLQCGADSIAGDPITHMCYSPAAHAHATARLCALAEECCEGRLLALGGGGYNRDNLARAWCAVVGALIEAAAAAKSREAAV